MIDQTRIDRGPACATIGGKKNTIAIRSGKEIRTGDGKTRDFTSVGSIGLNPLSTRARGKQNECNCETD